MTISGTMRQSQEQRLLQKLSPQMRQSLGMLAMSLPELREALYREMASNPVIDDIEQTLERAKESDCEAASEADERLRENDYPDDDYEPGQPSEADADSIERRRRFFDSQAAEETLEEHLIRQFPSAGIEGREAVLAETLVGELDGNGFFAGSMPDVEMVTGEDEGAIRAMLARIMQLDPPGCGATSLKECLLAQMDKLDGSPYAQEVREILERGHLEDIAAGNVRAVVEDLGMSEERYEDVLEALRTLDPRPARAFGRAGRSVAFVNPEVHAVRGADGRWIATVDSRSLPDVKISPRYEALLSDPSTDEATKQYIKEKIASANFLVEAIEHREQTIVKIAQAIFDAQGGFFEKGLKGLRPLTMQEIADAAGVHHTTVSRTVRDKYASTPRGTVELRRFFVSGVSTADGEEVSKDAVVDALKAIVGSEDPSLPMSDEAISAALKAKGFSVARRTVAKYRGALGIPGASARRKRS